MTNELGLRVDERTGRKYIEPIPQEEPEQEAVPQGEPIQEGAPAEEQGAPTNEEQGVPTNEEQGVPPVEKQEVPPVEAQQTEPQANVFNNAVTPPQNAPQDSEPMAPQSATQAVNAGKSDEELRNEFLDKVSETAHNHALQQLGLTEEDINIAEFSDDPELRKRANRYRAAVEINRKQIIDSYAERLRIAQEQANRYNQFQQGVKSWIDEQRAGEPHFDDIGNLMTTRYKEMPYGEAANIAPAMERAMNGQLDENSAEIVKNYYEQCRKEYYAKLNGTSTTPISRSPAVETHGTGADVDAPVDYAKMLREASPREKPSIIEAWIGSKR